MEMTGLHYALVAVFVIAYLMAAFEHNIHIKKSKPFLIAAGVMWIIASFILTSEKLHSEIHHAEVTDFDLFVFLLATILYSAAMERFGLFEWIGNKILGLTRSPMALFWIISVVAFLLSAASNMAVALIFGILTINIANRIADKAHRERFTLVCALSIINSANAGGAWFPFGSPSTLLLWLAGKVKTEELYTMIPATIACTLVTAILLSFFVPKTKIDGEIAQTRADWRAVLLAIIFFVLIIGVILAQQYLHLPPTILMVGSIGILGLLFATIFQMHSEQDNFWTLFGRAFQNEGDTLMFFVGAILAVDSMAATGILGELSKWIYTFGATTANITMGFLSAVVDNVLMAAALDKMNPAMDRNQWILVTYTLSVGGGMLSIGSAPGVILMGKLASHGYNFMSHLRLAWAILIGFFAGAWLLIK